MDDWTTTLDRDYQCSAVIRRGGRCNRWALSMVGSIPLCSQHRNQHRKFLRHALREHRWLRNNLGVRLTEELRLREISDEQRLIAIERARSERVYYVKSKTGLVKIGHSCRPRQRILSLQREHGPLKLLALEEGGYFREQERHEEWSHLRLDNYREWFQLDDELLDHITSLPQTQELSELQEVFS